jgi:AcrR family transcriptional regulator
MTEPVLTRERILAAAEDVLRRFGPGKATVVDVARALGVSHSTVYRYFPSKAALREAVVADWLARIADPLDLLVSMPEPAPERLRRWLDLMIAAKRKRVLAEPELFAAYAELASESDRVVKAHVEHLVGQAAQIIASGVAEGAFVTADPLVAARAVFDATSRFHKPAFAAEWRGPSIDAALEAVWALILGGLGAGAR